jgi:hypothetical protein
VHIYELFSILTNGLPDLLSDHTQPSIDSVGNEIAGYEQVGAEMTAQIIHSGVPIGYR